MKMGKGIKGKFVEIRNLPQSVLLRNKNSASFFWIPLLFTMIEGEIAREMNDESIGPWRHFKGEEKSKSYTTPQIIAKMKNDFLRLCGEKSFAIFACLREIKSLLQTPPEIFFIVSFHFSFGLQNWSSTNVLRLEMNLLITGLMAFTFRTWNKTIHV